MDIIENSAEKLIKQYSELLEKNGLNVSGIAKKQYNFEFDVLRNNEKVKVQTYFGKKGVKPVIQGDAASLLYGAVNELIFGEKLFQPVKSEIPEPAEYIGTDESGKGDYFGPLVIAGVFINQGALKNLLSAGVKDSKEISDNNIKIIASEIKKIIGDRYNIVVINPERYNQLYRQFMNVNKLLAWGHAKVIENILQKYNAYEAISDKFGDESLIKNELQSKGKGIVLHQFTKAEKYTAVAAASILARDRFNYWFEQQSKIFNMQLPKGASLKVDDAAVTIVKNYGKEVLPGLVKLHFKTTNKILPLN